jgi:hypothetical protein
MFKIRIFEFSALARANFGIVHGVSDSIFAVAEAVLLYFIFCCQRETRNELLSASRRRSTWSANCEYSTSKMRDDCYSRARILLLSANFLEAKRTASRESSASFLGYFYRWSRLTDFKKWASKFYLHFSCLSPYLLWPTASKKAVEASNTSQNNRFP